MLPVEITTNFKKHLAGKPKEIQKKTLQKIRLLATDPRHHSLQVHRVRGTNGVWEAYIDLAYRLTFEYGANGAIVLRNNNGHEVLKTP